MHQSTTNINPMLCVCTSPKALNQPETAMSHHMGCRQIHWKTLYCQDEKLIAISLAQMSIMNGPILSVPGCKDDGAAAYRNQDLQDCFSATHGTVLPVNGRLRGYWTLRSPRRAFEPRPKRRPASRSVTCARYSSIHEPGLGHRANTLLCRRVCEPGDRTSAGGGNVEEGEDIGVMELTSIRLWE